MRIFLRTPLENRDGNAHIHTHKGETMDRSSRTWIKIIEADGWYRVRQKGSHIQFKHPTKTGRVTIIHPVKDMKPGTINSIKHQAGLK